MCGLLPEMVSSQRRMEKKLVLKPLGRVVISPFGSVFSLVNMAAANDEFPEEFTIQRVRLAAAKGLAGLQPAHIAAYFRDHPEQAKDLLSESYDKRFTPSSFMTERSGSYQVGWFSKRAEYMCVRQFSNLADAATDYFLFSLGKGRWNPPETTV